MAIRDRSALPAVLARALPAVTRSAAAVAVGFAIEYGLRVLSDQALRTFRGRLPGREAIPSRPSMSSLSSIPSVPAVTRIVITEFVVVERTRRRQ